MSTNTRFEDLSEAWYGTLGASLRQFLRTGFDYIKHDFGSSGGPVEFGPELCTYIETKI